MIVVPVIVPLPLQCWKPITLDPSGNDPTPSDQRDAPAVAKCDAHCGGGDVASAVVALTPRKIPTAHAPLDRIVRMRRTA